MKTTLSLRLMNTVRNGKERLGKEALRRAVHFVESQRTEDEAFVNKSGKADLYYTFFGWFLSYLLGVGSNAEKRASYLAQQPVAQMDLVHYAAYMRCRLLHAWMKGERVRMLLNPIFPVGVRSLETFPEVPHQDVWSPYTRFIWLSLLEDTGHKEKEEVLDALARYRVPGGGYTNVLTRKVATTNATAAALAVIGQLKGYEPGEDLFYLWDTQDETGGFKATQASPVPDLLSTATALFILKNYEVQPCRPAADFIEAHWLDSGGFAATLWENDGDVEYLFYGLLALGAL